MATSAKPKPTHPPIFAAPSKLIFIFYALTLWLPSTFYGQKEPGAVDLRPSQTLERQMAGAETQSFRITLKKGEFFQTVVEQKGVDVALKLLDPDGKTLATMDSPNGKQGTETFSFIAPEAGSFILEVSGFDAKAEKGMYTIIRGPSRTANAKDRRRVEGERLFVEAIEARNADKQTDTALAKFKSALIIWRETGDTYLTGLTTQQIKQLDDRALKEKADKFYDDANALAQTEKKESLLASLKGFSDALALYVQIDNKREQMYALNRIGRVYSDLKQKTEAIENYKKALDIAEDLKDKKVQAIILDNIAFAHNVTGDKPSALDYYKKELPLRKEIGDLKAEARTYYELGSVYDDLDDEPNAVDAYGQSARLYNTAKDKKGEAAALNSQARVYIFTGQTQNALDTYLEALSLWIDVGDSGNEASTRRNIANAYSDLNNKPKSLEFYSQALKYYTDTNDTAGKAMTFSGMGDVYLSMGNNKTAMEQYDLALPLFIEVKDKNSEGQTRNDIGNVFSRLGDIQSAMTSFELALRIYKSTQSKSGEAASLVNIGKIHADKGENLEALDCFNQALALRREKKNKNGEAVALNFIGTIFSNLGNSPRAMENYNHALGLFQEKGDKTGEALARVSIGQEYSKTGNKTKALEYLEKGFSLYQEVGNKLAAAYALTNIATAYYKSGDNEKALERYEKTLPLYKATGNKFGEAATLNNIGGIYRKRGNYRKAIEYYSSGLTLLRALDNRRGQAIALSNISGGWDELNNRGLAIFFGKQSVNIYQGLRSNIRGLDKDLQQSFLGSAENTYRNLAELLIKEGRIPEAEQILAMLKEEESSEYLGRDASEVEKLSQRSDLSKGEAEALIRFNKFADDIAEIGRRQSELAVRLNQGVQLSAEEQKTYAQLSKQLEDSNRSFDVFLRQLSEEFSKKTTAVSDLKEDRGLKSDLRNWQGGVVFLHTLVGDDRYRVILTTADVQTDGKTDIKALELNAKIEAFRQAVQNPKSDPRPLGRELYDIIIKPVEKQLDDAKAKTLLWSLDGSLRLLPLAALWDGNQYFGQKYQNVIITLASRSRLSEKASSSWSVLGLGVTEAKTVKEPNGTRAIPFRALPAVREELLAVVHDEGKTNETGVLAGKRLIDSDFTEDNLKSELVKGFKVVHIASHFSLNPGDATKSFLLLGDGTALTVDDIKNSPQLQFNGVELLTLSACQTAVVEKDGNGKEIEGFGYVAQRNGAKAILASLWKVDDESTSQLMRQFYQLRQSGNLTKVEALQKAQLTLLQSKNFSHPYYWAPFILIGNWR